MYWNVGGLLNITTNLDWIEFVGNRTILCIQETWATEAVHINGFSTHHLSAVSSRSGRPKGGLTIYVIVSYGARVYTVIEGTPYHLILGLEFTTG